MTVTTDSPLQPDELLDQEEELLRGLFRALDETTETYVRIQVPSVAEPETILFSFRVRPLRGEEVERCSDDASQVEVNRRTGVRQVVDFDSSRFRSLLIYTATHGEDRKAIWDNRKVWQRAGVLSGIEAVDYLLPAGMKEAVANEISRLSGFDAALQTTAKN